MLWSQSTFDRLRLQVRFFTGSGSSSYKNRLKSIFKKRLCLHIFSPAPAPSKKVLVLSGSATLAMIIILKKEILTGSVAVLDDVLPTVRLAVCCWCTLYNDILYELYLVKQFFQDSLGKFYLRFRSIIQVKKFFFSLL